MEEPTLLSIAGAGLYFLAALTCILAGWNFYEVTKKKQKNWIWIGIGVFFILLAASRLLQIEEAISLALKAEFIENADYSERRGWQRPFVAAALAISMIATMWLIRRFFVIKKGGAWHGKVAVLAVIGLGTIVLLRIISFHATDKLLYGFRLNWVLDPGLTCVVIAVSLLAIREGRAKALS